MTMALATQDAEDAGPTMPMRRCLATGVSMPAGRLIRFVAGPDGVVVPDIEGRLPGRGLWVSCRRDMVETVVSRGLFARGARRAVTAMTGPNGESLAVRVDTLLERRALERLAMVRKAGRFVFGALRVGEALDRLAGRGPAAEGAGGAPVLLLASDAAADGRSVSAKFANRARTELSRCALFDAASLGRLAGRDNVVHALVLPGAGAKHFQQAMDRLSAYRGLLALDALDGDLPEGRAGASEDDVTDE